MTCPGDPGLPTGRLVRVLLPTRLAALPEQARTDLLAMFTAYDRGGLVGDPAPLAELLGRTPTSWEQAVRS